MVAATVTNQGFSPWFSDANRQLRMVWSVEFIGYRLWVTASCLFVFYRVGASRSGMLAWRIKAPVASVITQPVTETA
jgi:hypothetical protein